MSRCIVVEYDDHNGAVEYGRIVGEVVRCHECAKWTNGDDISGICQWNEYRTLQTDANAFCSYGVRKE